MISSLKIQDLILIRRAEIAFGPGLNIITGETGSGKSAVLSAIRLICGERAETQLIRKDASFACVEACLTSYSLEPFPSEGIDPPPQGAPLHIRREIHASGKSRCFIEDQQVSLSFLKRCVGGTVERVDQSASAALCSPDEQRNMLDAYGEISTELASFRASFESQKQKESELQAFVLSQSQKERELEWAQNDLTAIEEINWQPGEEEKLAHEHHLLTHAQELAEKTGSASSVITEILPSLKRSYGWLEYCARIDEQAKTFFEPMKNAIIELEEIDLSLHSYLERIETDPNRLQAVEQRMGAIESLKRRFGTDPKALAEKKEKLTSQIDHLLHLDAKIEEARTSLSQIQEDNRQAAERISSKRKSAALALAPRILEQLKSLNLPHAQFEIKTASKYMSSNGIDEIRFLFSANPGVPPIPLENCASGGELSRLLLAIKTVLAERERSSCLIFDEIDSNVGGQTAAILGEKLKKLSENRQVICVTHFVQVARCAAHHFLVCKKDDDGTAATLVSRLGLKEREREFSRMLGNPSFGNHSEKK